MSILVRQIIAGIAIRKRHVFHVMRAGLKGMFMIEISGFIIQSVQKVILNHVISATENSFARNVIDVF
jgi:hypothetical protein